MKKYMNMPDVKVVRFDNKDIVCTSDKMDYDGTTITEGTLSTQARRSIWE